MESSACNNSLKGQTELWAKYRKETDWMTHLLDYSVAEWTDRLKGEHILDLGCGTGHYNLLMRK